MTGKNLILKHSNNSIQLVSFTVTCIFYNVNTLIMEFLSLYRF